jgi:hypothetical protein
MVPIPQGRLLNRCGKTMASSLQDQDPRTNMCGSTQISVAITTCPTLQTAPGATRIETLGLQPVSMIDSGTKKASVTEDVCWKNRHSKKLVSRRVLVYGVPTQHVCKRWHPSGSAIAYQVERVVVIVVNCSRTSPTSLFKTFYRHSTVLMGSVASNTRSGLFQVVTRALPSRGAAQPCE